MPGGGMERMVGIISALAQISQQRKDLEFRKQQQKENAANIARQLGLAENTEEFKQITNYIKLFTDSDVKTRPALKGIAQIVFKDKPELQPQFEMLASNAPMSLEALRTMAANQGMQPGASPIQQESYIGAVAPGMNRGNVAMSGFQGQLAGSAQNQLTPFMGREFAQRTAGGNSVFDAQMDQRLMADPELMRKLAAVRAGTEMTAAQQAQADIGRGGVEAQFEGIRLQKLLAQLDAEGKAALASGSALTPALVSAYNAMTDKLKVMNDPKSNEAVRNQAAAEYNKLADDMGRPDLKWPEVPGKPNSILKQFIQKVNPPGAPNPNRP